jgi:hypothetical protein
MAIVHGMQVPIVFEVAVIPMLQSFVTALGIVFVFVIWVSGFFRRRGRRHHS